MMKTGMTKALAVIPPAIVSGMLMLMVVALLPPVAAAGVTMTGLLVALLLLFGIGEDVAARALAFSRPAQSWELELLAPALTVLCRAALGPPLIRIRVRPSPLLGTVAFGRHTVVVSTALIGALADRKLPHDQAAAVIGHAAALLRSGRTRCDAAIQFWTTPWQVMRVVVALVTRSGRGLPFAAAAWRLRFVVVTIAVVQNLQAELPWLSGLIGAIGATTYLIPYWTRRWEDSCAEAADQILTEAGLAAAWAAYLRPCRHTPRLRRRLVRLDPPTHPQIGIVTAR